MEWATRLQQSDGYHGMALKDQVKRVGYVFQGNVAQYKSLVAELQNPEVALPITAWRNQDGHDQLLSEAERLLHNVLTAMSTRVDHLRAFMAERFADDAELTGEYHTKVESEFLADPQAVFLKGLRNYIAHRSLPVARSKQTFGPQIFSVTFVLPCEPLLRWKGWNQGQRKSIADFGDAVPIVDVVDTYARKVGEFDRWLFDRIGLKYAVAISAFLCDQEGYTQEVDRRYGS